MRKYFYVAMSFALFGLLVTPPAFGQTKTAKACRDEWRANKADNQAKGITEKAYVDECRAGTAAAPTTSPPTTTTTAPSPKQSVPPPVVVAPTAKPQPATKPAPSPTAAPAASGQFSSEAQAKGHCPSDTVVWVNLKSKIYHFSKYKPYGTTSRGAYMCEKESDAAGFRPAKNEKHP
jgi:hypothetical protein